MYYLMVEMIYRSLSILCSSDNSATQAYIALVPANDTGERDMGLINKQKLNQQK